MELMSLPTTVIWFSILMLVPAALCAGLVLTGIAKYFAGQLVVASVTRIRTAWLSWRSTIPAQPRRAIAAQPQAASPTPVSSVVSVAPAVRASIIAP